MPIVKVQSKIFFQLLGQEIDFDTLYNHCYQYGIEIEQEENNIMFEVATNRPDLLCVENIALTFSVYLGITNRMPEFKIKNHNRCQLMVTGNTKPMRPFVVACVLRNIKFDQDSYQSHIDLQEKLNLNFCRKRRLVAIGTHDLDKMSPPFLYDARRPEEIVFKPLNKSNEMNGVELMAHYEKDLHLKEFLPIIRNSEKYPVIYDKNMQVLALCPIVNGEDSKITVNTKNIFIECTATDMTRAEQTINILVSSMTKYCEEQYSVEEVEIIYLEEKNKDGNPRVDIQPKIKQRKFITSLQSIQNKGGFQVEMHQALEILRKMGHQAEKKQNSHDEIEVLVSMSRTDVIHECDIVEDICIGYGYNNIVPQLPQFSSVGKQQFLNKMTDLIREQIANCGYQEGFNFALSNEQDLYTQMLKPIDDQITVQIKNPRTSEFTCGRTSLLPGCLKWLFHNSKSKIPIKIFEVGDVVLKDKNTEQGAKNQKNICVILSDSEDQLEDLIGLLDIIMAKLKIQPKSQQNIQEEQKVQGNFYKIQAPQQPDPSFITGRQAHIFYNQNIIGILGIINPQIHYQKDHKVKDQNQENQGIKETVKWSNPICALEMSIDLIIQEFIQ